VPLAAELGHWVPIMLLACVLGTTLPLSVTSGAACDSLSLLWLRSLPATTMFVASRVPS